MARCEVCGAVVPPSIAPPLPTGDAADYRLFGDLLSVDGAVAGRARELLPSAIRGASRTALVETAVRVGLLVTSGDPAHLRLDAVADLDPDRVARIACEGTRMLRGWPGSIREAVDRTGAEGSDVEAFYGVRKHLRWIARGAKGSDVDPLAIAFPNLAGRILDAFATREDYYDATETKHRLWIDSDELALLRAIDAIDHKALPSLRRVRARYGVESVERLRALLRSSTAPATVAERWRMPKYAVAQLGVAGILGVVDDAGVIALRGARISDSSIVDLEAAIRGVGARAAPVDAVPLGNALAACEGEKPWAALITAMLAGDLAFHLAGDAFSSRTLLVPRRRAVAIALAKKAEQPEQTLAPFDCSLVTMRDACEVLTTGWKETVMTLVGSKIACDRVGSGRAVERAKLLGIAAARISTFEFSMASGLAPARAAKLLTRLGVPRLLGGWCRSEVRKRGLLIPAASD